MKTLENKVFEGCASLHTVKIGTELEKLGQQVFSKCSALKQITIDTNNNVYSTVNNVIFNKNQTKLIYYPIALPEKQYIIPSSVTTIGKEAFIESKFV